MDGPNVTLTAPAAQTIGMALHELATNATKYGAWSVASGKVLIGWTIDPEATAMHLDWIESGGPPVVAPARKGFGHIVLENMVSQSVRATFASIMTRQAFNGSCRFRLIILQTRQRPPVDGVRLHITTP
jgi:two-component sensor histidine kinase